MKNKIRVRFASSPGKWINREHIRKSNSSDLVSMIRSSVPTSVPDSSLRTACSLAAERAHTITELSDACVSIFSRNDGSYYRGVVDDESLGFLCDFRHVLSDVAPSTFNAGSAKAYFDATIELSDISPRKAGIALRAILCSNKVGPSIFEIMELLGLIECLERLESA